MTEVPGELLGEAPENFGIAARSEGGGNLLGGTPTQAGLYALTLRVGDETTGQSDTTTLPLQITWKKGFAITTTALPDAFVDSAYSVMLSHNDKPDTKVTWSLACVYGSKSTAQGFSYECVDGDPAAKLPPGLTFNSDGSFAGTPSAPPAAVGTDTPVYSFLVKAVDASGRQDVRGLSIKLRPAIPTGGCSVGPGPAAFALLALAGLARRRR